MFNNKLICQSRCDYIYEKKMHLVRSAAISFHIARRLISVIITKCSLMDFNVGRIAYMQHKEQKIHLIGSIGSRTFVWLRKWHKPYGNRTSAMSKHNSFLSSNSAALRWHAPISNRFIAVSPSILFIWQNILCRTLGCRQPNRNSNPKKQQQKRKRIYKLCTERCSYLNSSYQLFDRICEQNVLGDERATGEKIALINGLSFRYPFCVRYTLLLVRSWRSFALSPS